MVFVIIRHYAFLERLPKQQLFLIPYSEVAADGERLGLLLYLWILFDLGLELDIRLALDPLRTGRIRACRFARRTSVLRLAVRTVGAHRAAVFPLTVRARVAHRAAVFPLTVRARVAHRALVFRLAMRVGVALQVRVFQPAVRA